MVFPIEPARLGGFRKPISVWQFITDRLAAMGEDYIANIHRSYKEALAQAALERGRRKPYHRPVYHSTEMVVQKLAREGIVEFSGREEESDNPQFINWDPKPVRRYYRLV